MCRRRRAWGGGCRRSTGVPLSAGERQGCIAIAAAPRPAQLPACSPRREFALQPRLQDGDQGDFAFRDSVEVAQLLEHALQAIETLSRQGRRRYLDGVSERAGPLAHEQPIKDCSLRFRLIQVERRWPRPSDLVSESTQPSLATDRLLGPSFFQQLQI